MRSSVLVILVVAHDDSEDYRNSSMSFNKNEFDVSYSSNVVLLVLDAWNILNEKKSFVDYDFPSECN